MPKSLSMIREATTNDIPSIIDFQQKMAWETEHIKLDPLVLAMGIKNLFQDINKGKYYVAEENGVVIGSLMTTYEWSEWRNGTVLWIQSVYIAEDHRGKGIYKKLYDHVQKSFLPSAECDRRVFYKFLCRDGLQLYKQIESRAPCRCAIHSTHR